MIKIENLNKSFKNKKIITDLSLEIKENEMIALVGPSGVGKSTLLNIMGLLEPYDSGQVTIMGQTNIKPLSKKASKLYQHEIGFLFQNYGLIDGISVYDNLKFLLKGPNKRSKVIEALKQVNLEDFIDKNIYTLSGGEQQRVALAKIILQDSKIILADEPTGSLDKTNRDLVLKILNQLNQKNKTIVIVTHDEEVAAICQRTINLIDA